MKDLMNSAFFAGSLTLVWLAGLFVLRLLGIHPIDAELGLLLAVAILLWEVLKWLKLIAEGLGCNKDRTKQIKRLMKRLGYADPEANLPSKLANADKQRLDEELDELFEAELFERPAKGGQAIKLLERMDALTKLLDSRLKPLD